MLNFSSSLFPAVVRTLLAVLLLAGSLTAVAQAPGWQSAQVVAVATAAATNNSSEVTATAVDAAGNVYLAGSFTNTVVLGGTTLTSLGGSDVFVAKFNPASNQFVWVQRAGGSADDQATALAVSGPNVYVAGHFRSPAMDFGTITLGNTHPSWTDMFVAKLVDAGSMGSFVWAQRAGGQSGDYAAALAVSGTSVYVTGYFAGGSPRFGTITLPGAGQVSAFVAKLTDAGSTGSFVWVQQVGGIYNDYTTALAVSGTSVYVAGYFTSPTVAFGPVTLTNTSSNGGYDIFVAKLTDAGSTGSFVWAQQAGGPDYDYATALTVSGTSVYVAGWFGSRLASFGPITLTAATRADLFVAKLTDAGSTGSFAWAQQAGGLAQQVGPGNAATALAISGTRLYMAGAFNTSTATFGPIALTNPYSSLFPYTNLGYLASLTDPTLTATTPPRTTPQSTLYPNPAHGTATLQLPAGTTPAPLALCDALGRAVRRYPAPAGPETPLDLHGLPAGLYLLRGSSFSQRLIVE